MIKAIVLDIGGVLIRTEDRSFRNKLEKKYGLKPKEADKLVFHSKPAQASTVGKVRCDAVWKHVANELALSKEELIEFQNQFWAGDQLDIKLMNFLQKVHSNYTTALLSNAWLGHRQIFEEDYNFIKGQTVDTILLSGELGVAKPDPHIYAILADTIQCAYDEILFVDDFLENIEAANALGIHTIHYHPGMNLINEIKSRLDKKR
jgi:glucose-1-phosphatase